MACSPAYVCNSLTKWQPSLWCIWKAKGLACRDMHRSILSEAVQRALPPPKDAADTLYWMWKAVLGSGGGAGAGVGDDAVDGRK